MTSIILFRLELQSLSLYILASIDRDNLRSTESGIKYFVLSALFGLLLYGCSLLYVSLVLQILIQYQIN